MAADRLILFVPSFTQCLHAEQVGTPVCAFFMRLSAEVEMALHPLTIQNAARAAINRL